MIIKRYSEYTWLQNKYFLKRSRLYTLELQQDCHVCNRSPRKTALPSAWYLLSSASRPTMGDWLAHGSVTRHNPSPFSQNNPPVSLLKISQRLRSLSIVTQQLITLDIFNTQDGYASQIRLGTFLVYTTHYRVKQPCPHYGKRTLFFPHL